jgi:hypothetical protein
MSWVVTRMPRSSRGQDLGLLKVSLNAFSVFQLTHGNYVPVFLLAGSAYVVAIAAIHLLAPRLAVVVMD